MIKCVPVLFCHVNCQQTERNYDAGDQELLAIKVTLEEWRHWLEGVAQPFLVWIDHKNLEYLQTAKRLSPCQASWAMFFCRFNFCNVSTRF